MGVRDGDPGPGEGETQVSPGRALVKHPQLGVELSDWHCLHRAQVRGINNMRMIV